MDETRPDPAEGPRRISRLWDALDRWFFREPDLRATARGWTVRKIRRFEREYRDPRWDLVVRCDRCGGEGALGTHPCPECEGRGRVLLRDDERVARR